MKKLNFKIAILTVIFSTFIFACSKDGRDNSAKESNDSKLLARGSAADEVKLDLFANYLISENLLVASQITSIDRTNSFIQVIDNIDILFLVVKNNKSGGVIKGVLTSSIGQNMLPHHNKYLIVYDEYSNLNHSTNTGKVSSYDLNYNVKFNDLSIKNGLVEFDDSFPVSTNPTVDEHYGTNGVPDSCLGGRDGNVSWGECMSCSKEVCHADPTCHSICDAINHISDIFGILGGTGPGCTATLAISCIAVAAVY